MSDLQGTAVTVLLPSSGKQADSATTPGSTGRDEGNAGALPFSVQLSRAASDSRTRSGGSADATDRDSRPAQSIVQQEIPENGDATDQPALVGLPEAAASHKRTVEQKTVIIEDAVLPAHNGSVGTEHLEAEVLVAETDLTELTIDSAGKQATEAENASPGHEKHALADKGSEQEGVPLLAAQSPSSNAVELTPREEVPFRTVDTVSEEPGASISQATDTDGSMTAEREYSGPLVGSIRTSRDIDAGFHEPPATRADASNLPFQVRRQSVEVSPMSTAVAAAASASGSASDSVAAAVTLTASATNAATATVTTSTTVLATPVSMVSAEVSTDLPPSTRGADGSSIPVDRTAAGLTAGKLPTPSGEEVSAMELAWAQNKSALTSGTRPVTQGLSDTPTSKLLNQDGELQLGKLAALDTRSVQDKPAGNATSGTLHNAVAQAVGNALQSPDERQARGKAAALPMSGQAMNLLPADKTLQSDALVSAESPDNMFHLTTSGTVTAAQRVRGDSRAAELASAPHSVSILAPDAEEALSGNVKWMVNDGVKNALINVNPSGMGPITVKLDIDKEQMNVSIIASQGSTREALDVLLPRLREQLGAQGFDSVRVDVSDGRSDGSKGNSHQQPSQGRSDFGGMEHSGTKGEGDRNSAETLMQESELASESSEPALTLSMNEARGGHDRTRSGAALFDAYV